MYTVMDSQTVSAGEPLGPYLRVVQRPLQRRHDVRKAVCFQQSGLGDDDRPVHVERCDLFLAQIWGQFPQLKLCPFVVQRHFWFRQLDCGGFDGGQNGEFVPFAKHGTGCVVNDGAAAAAFYCLFQDGLVVHLDAFEFEVALPRVTPLVVLRQGVELLRVEVADGAQVQRVQDNVRVISIYVFFEGVEVLSREGAIFALISPLLSPLRFRKVWGLGSRFVRSCGRV